MALLDDARFAELFHRHYPRLVGLARRVLGDAKEAEDAAQEALLALRVDPVAERSDVDIAAWLTRVVTNGSLNRLRSRRRADVLAQVVGSRDHRHWPMNPLRRRSMPTSASGFERPSPSSPSDRQRPYSYATRATAIAKSPPLSTSPTGRWVCCSPAVSAHSDEPMRR